MKKQTKQISGKHGDSLKLHALPEYKTDTGYTIYEGIVLQANAGNFSFQFAMTPAQAIELAAALVDFATEEEEITEGAAA